MAKVISSNLIVSVSKLVKDSDETRLQFTDEAIETLEETLEKVLPPGSIIEISIVDGEE